MPQFILAAIPLNRTTATKSAFKHSDLEDTRSFIWQYMAWQRETPDRAALILLSDSPSGDDGILEASEIVHLHTNADLVVLSPAIRGRQFARRRRHSKSLSRVSARRCEGRSFYALEHRRHVCLYLMKRFYAHLADRRTAAYALTAANGTCSKLTVPRRSLLLGSFRLMCRRSTAQLQL